MILIMVSYIVRLANQKLSDMLNGPLPTLATPRPSTHRPPHINLVHALAANNIGTLAEISPALQIPRPRPLGPPPLPTPAPATAPTPAPAAAPAGTTPRVNQELRRPDQNPRLKAAWTATGDAALFGPGRRFHDPDGPGRKKVIQRLEGDTTKRICIPMACRGVCFQTCGGYHGPLSSAEEEAVAAAGGFTL